MENQRTECSSAEIKFSRGREDFLHVELRGNGEAVVYVGGDDPGPCSEYTLTLGQAIQLRDFLNRHIDGLARKQISSLAARGIDDPNQLAAVEDGSPSQLKEPSSSEGCGKALYGHHLNMVRCGDPRTARCTSCGGVFIPQGDE